MDVLQQRMDKRQLSRIAVLVRLVDGAHISCDLIVGYFIALFFFLLMFSRCDIIRSGTPRFEFAFETGIYLVW